MLNNKGSVLKINVDVHSVQGLIHLPLSSLKKSKGRVATSNSRLFVAVVWCVVCVFVCGLGWFFCLVGWGGFRLDFQGIFSFCFFLFVNCILLPG